MLDSGHVKLLPLCGIFSTVCFYVVSRQCDPNLAVYGVWINHLDPRLPRIALFAKRDIAKEEELTFDYMMTGNCMWSYLQWSLLAETSLF